MDDLPLPSSHQCIIILAFPIDPVIPLKYPLHYSRMMNLFRRPLKYDREQIGKHLQ